MRNLTSDPLVTLEPTEGLLSAVVENETKAPEKITRKVLLLEDDAVLQELLSEYLSSLGFSVKAVENGVAGVQEVLSSDFEVIFCDMMMPKLPGDMFYRAVERMRPYLCDRFVFMTGHGGVSKVGDFMQQVSVPRLNKPFQLDDLLEMVAFIQVRNAIQATAN